MYLLYTLVPDSYAVSPSAQSLKKKINAKSTGGNLLQLWIVDCEIHFFFKKRAQVILKEQNSICS